MSCGTTVWTEVTDALSAPRSYPYSYAAYDLVKSLLIPLLPSSARQIVPTLSHIKHRWQEYHNRQPSWRILADWLADMRDRSAWAQVNFGFIGDDIEMAVSKRGPMGILEVDERKRSR